MTFVLLKPWHGDPDGAWWEWNEETMQLINFNGGRFDIDENSDYWAHAITCWGCDSWHDLYMDCGYNPMKADISDYDVWISPEGEFFEGRAHLIQAEQICELVYGFEEDSPCREAEDYLISHGWVKATRSCMWTIYQKRDTTWYMTKETLNALFDYCNMHNLKMPERIKVISKEKAQRGGIYGKDNILW